MHRYTCADCAKLHRSSDPSRIRCRRCLNKIAPGDGNRPNRRIKKARVVKAKPQNTFAPPPPKRKR